jgi:CheY-like chemotaxis protein
MTPPRSVLILECSAVTRSLLRRELTQDFACVVSAASQFHALEQLEMVAFDLVIIEVPPGDDSLFAFIRRLRLGECHNRRVPLIVVSGERQRAVIEKARAAGAHGFLVKPFSRTSLHAQVARALDDCRDYIDSPAYSGLDRRRWRDPAYTGPERRRDARCTLYIA